VSIYECKEIKEDITNYWFRRLGDHDKEVDALVRAMEHIENCTSCYRYYKDLTK